MSSIRTQLSVMMFFEFFIWGAWLPVSFGYYDGLGFSGLEQVLVNICFPVAAIIAMFFGNQFVDRNFAAERYLAFSQLIGGLAIMALAWTTHFPMFLFLMALHCLFYVPTISVVNTIAFANMKDSQKEFGPIRLWGTIGWIAAAWPFIFLLLDWTSIPSISESKDFVEWIGTALSKPLSGPALQLGKSWAFFVAGVASLILAVFSLTLPHTPPKPPELGAPRFAWLEVARFLRIPFMLVLFVVTFIDAAVHDGYFIFAFSYLEKVGVPSNWILPAMSIWQVAEIATMALLGFVLKSLGWRYTMVLGILGHAARFAVFALLPDPYVAVAVNVLHGICYAFFFATLYIFVDEFFPKDARTSAQGLFNFLILGLGPIASRNIWPSLQNYFTISDSSGVKTVEYSKLLLIPSGTAIVAAVLLLLFFHPPRSAEAMNEPHGV